MRILPSLLRPGLRVVFCGTAAGTASARRGAYYAGRGNRFWGILATTGMAPRQFRPEEYRHLLPLGIGLTDLVPRRAGMDRTLGAADFDLEAFARQMRRARPAAIAFNGKAAAAVALGLPSTSLRFGEQSVRLHGARVWVLPSTSGAANGCWSETPWRSLARALRGIRDGDAHGSPIS